MSAYTNFLCGNIRLIRVVIASPGTDVAMISLYQSVTSPAFLDIICFKTGTGSDERFIPIHVLASELGLPTYCLLPAMHAVSGCDSVGSFSHIEKITIF